MDLASRIRRHEEHFDHYVLEVADFQPGEEDLLRGCSLATVLSDQGRLFTSSEGTSQTYALSRRVSNIDAFISHNWSVPRRDKFFALSMHFGLLRAALVSGLVVAGLGVLTAVGYLPAVGFKWADHPRGIYCRLFCIPTFLAAMIFHPRCGWCCRDTIVFLDKICIEQVDLDLKAKGIEKLGAFLQRSSSMVVIYTDVYLQRLWTVYEVAAFLALHPVSRMEFIPTFVPYIVFVGLMCFHLSGIVATAIELYLGFRQAYDVTSIPLCYLFFIAMRDWSRGRAAFRDRLTTFSVQKCTCFCEDDRSKVYHNIAVLMRTAGIVCREAGDEEALSAFNDFARRTLPEAVDATVGTLGLRYKHILSITACAFGAYVVDEIAGGVPSGMPLHLIYSNIMWWFTMVVSVIPLIIVGISESLSHCLQLKAWREWTFVMIVGLIGVGFIQLYVFGLNRLQDWGSESRVGMCVFTAYSMSPFPFTLVVFSNCKARRFICCCRSWLGASTSQREGAPLRGEVFGAAASSEADAL